LPAIDIILVPAAVILNIAAKAELPRSIFQVERKK
jgi:hypothetical protein